MESQYTNAGNVVGVFGVRGGGTSAIAGVVHLLGYKTYGRPKTLDDDELLTGNRSKIIEQRTKDWMFKHPFLIQDVQWFKDNIPRLKCIYVFRDPVATASHGGGKQQLSIIAEDWKLQEHMLNDQDALYISYERAITEREKTVQQIAEYINRPVNVNAVKWLDPLLKYRNVSDYE